MSQYRAFLSLSVFFNEAGTAAGVDSFCRFFPRLGIWQTEIWTEKPVVWGQNWTILAVIPIHLVPKCYKATVCLNELIFASHWKAAVTHRSIRLLIVCCIFASFSSWSTRRKLSSWAISLQRNRCFVSTMKKLCFKVSPPQQYSRNSLFYKNQHPSAWCRRACSYFSFMFCEEDLALLHLMINTWNHPFLLNVSFMCNSFFHYNPAVFFLFSSKLIDHLCCQF